MATLHLDTHVLVWLKQGNPRLGKKQQGLIERHDCLISPMVLLELEMLHEIGRVKVAGKVLIEQLEQEINLMIDSSRFEKVSRRSMDFGFTRDPFDRVICAQADVAKRKLLTADNHLRSNFPAAIWD